MMEVTKVLTSVFVLCLSGPTFGYPFTRSGGNLFSAPGGEASVAGTRGGHQQGQQQQLPAHLEDYLANYVQQGAAAVPARQFPQYQPAYQQGYIAQVPPQPKLTAETLAALLPYLSSSSGASLNGVSASGPSDYVWEMPDYPAAAPPAYTDDDGTWYDDMAGQASQVFSNNEPMMRGGQDEEEQAVLQLLLDHLNGRYSLDDLEAMEREAEMEENTESQLQSLMNKKQMVKKSVVAAASVPGASLGSGPSRSGQKEEAPLMPATSVRRPVWGGSAPAQQHHQPGAGHRQGASSEASGMNTETKRSISEQGTLVASTAQGNTNNKVSDSSSSSSTPASASSSSTAITDGASNSDHSSADSVVAQEGTTMTPRLQTAYDALKNYLDRERKFRQEQDDIAEMAELTEPSRGGIHKRFAPDEDVLSQQLVNLKKNRT